ncbi:hypothetical protein DM02DRAFT_667131 [Periconia macrospinosa]|uniref:HAUS augmin-like complex subunit 1 n=1 Tax=Periconia macrospinosa TaxID=97972 RepID=A0A2V1EAE3_9PLEO|nr:hypothetical protein DM02DRAFT_667131 [Periconia macrospinosa]
MDSLTPQDLFSPSKARQQREQAADWAQIDSWLSYKYSGRTVPTFERNEETLKVLRELAAANERADEERMVLERVEREAARELEDVESKTSNTENEKLLEAIKHNLTPDGQESLHALATTAVILNTPTTDPETLAHALISHTQTSQTLTNNLAHVRTLQGYLKKQHALLREQLHTIQSDPAFATPPTLQRQTTEQIRQTKHLRAKIREHEDRLMALQNSGRAAVTPASRGVSSAEAIADMLEQQNVLDGMREKVEALEREVDMYKGLPADKEAARREVAKLEVELDLLRRRRDDLFANLVS